MSSKVSPTSSPPSTPSIKIHPDDSISNITTDNPQRSSSRKGGILQHIKVTGEDSFIMICSSCRMRDPLKVCECCDCLVCIECYRLFGNVCRHCYDNPKKMELYRLRKSHLDNKQCCCTIC